MVIRKKKYDPKISVKKGTWSLLLTVVGIFLANAVISGDIGFGSEYFAGVVSFIATSYLNYSKNK